MIPLFEQYPLLAHKLPYVSLGIFPTPVQKFDQLGRQLGLDNLFINLDSRAIIPMPEYPHRDKCKGWPVFA
jgi:hypothetical protein